MSNNLPMTTNELCPGPCGDGDTCFCDLGMDLVFEGVRKLQEKWPTMTAEDAAFLVGEMVADNAATVAQQDGRFISTLITMAVNLALRSFGPPLTADNIASQLRVERDIKDAIEHVLRDRVRDLDPGFTAA